MKLKNTILSILSFGILCSSCSKFDDFNTNPDASTRATSAMIATSLILNITKQGGNKYFVNDNMLSKQIAWGEAVQSYQYNFFGRTSFDGYTILTNCEKMVELADTQDVEAYSGLGKFLKAYKLFWISMEVGDIPYSDALNADGGVQKPIYDTQKEVMGHILNDLEAAYTHFDKATTFKGDPIFKGDPMLWKKTVAAFQLKVLMHLCNKEADQELSVVSRFAKIVSSSALMESNADNLQLTYSNKASQIYPFHFTQTKHAEYTMIATPIIDNLKRLNDYRMFYYASPSKYQIVKGLTPDNWNAYLSVDPSMAFSDLSTLYSDGKYVDLNPRYTKYEAGEPLIRLGYAEQNFILAEAAVRGWIDGDASAYYKKGIQASMQFISANTPDNPICHHDRKLTDSYIQEYLEQEAVQLIGDQSTKLEAVLLQRYLSSFLQHPYDAYFDYRRTGYPVLPIDPNTSLNAVKDKIPTRWMYPTDEFSFNLEQVERAVKRQYGGNDAVNQTMWILKTN